MLSDKYLDATRCTVLVHITTVPLHTIVNTHSEAQYFLLNLEEGRTKLGVGTCVMANGYLEQNSKLYRGNQCSGPSKSFVSESHSSH
jgi:hypothetical protein